MLAQAVRGERRALGDQNPDLLGEVLALGAEGVADDLVAVAWVGSGESMKTSRLRFRAAA